MAEMGGQSLLKNEKKFWEKMAPILVSSFISNLGETPSLIMGYFKVVEFDYFKTRPYLCNKVGIGVIISTWGQFVPRSPI